MSDSNRLDPHVPNAIAEIITDGNGALRRYYALYRDAFVQWARSRFGYSDNDYLEVFHETMIVFWEKTEAYQSNKPKCRFGKNIAENPAEHPACDCAKGKEVCKLDQYTCLLKTYLFAVGYRKLLQKNPAKSKTVFLNKLPDPPDFDRILSELEENEMVHELTRRQLEQAFSQLSDTCQNLLKLYYFEKRKIPEITQTLSYANDNVTRVQKFRCLNRLRELLNE